MFKAENGAVIYFNKFLGGTGGTWNLKQPIFKRLFQLDDSNFFYTKMVVSTNIHYKMVFWSSKNLSGKNIGV